MTGYGMCGVCGKVYIGQSGRSIQLRIKEHEKTRETGSTL